MAIGGNHLVHAAARNIDLTVVMVNNNIYGMTGGQKSPTTPENSKTKTSPFGSYDEPIDGCKMVLALGASHVARWTVAHPVQLAKAIEEGLQHRGFSFIEVLAQCPTQAGKGVYGEKDPARIMEGYKKGTYRYKAGEAPQEGLIPIGTFRKDEGAREYIQKIEEKLAAEGIR